MRRLAAEAMPARRRHLEHELEVTKLQQQKGTTRLMELRGTCK